MLSSLAGTTVPGHVGWLPISAETLSSMQAIKRGLKPDCASSPKSKIRGKYMGNDWSAKGSLADRNSAETMKQIYLYSFHQRTSGCVICSHQGFPSLSAHLHHTGEHLYSYFRVYVFNK